MGDLRSSWGGSVLLFYTKVWSCLQGTPLLNVTNSPWLKSGLRTSSPTDRTRENRGGADLITRMCHSDSFTCNRSSDFSMTSRFKRQNILESSLHGVETNLLWGPLRRSSSTVHLPLQIVLVRNRTSPRQSPVRSVSLTGTFSPLPFYPIPYNHITTPPLRPPCSWSSLSDVPVTCLRIPGPSSVTVSLSQGEPLQTTHSLSMRPQ